MRRKKFTKCVKCGAKLGEGNTSGHCRKCAMAESGRQRRQENAEFAMLVQACRMVGGEARGRLLYHLLEERRSRHVVYARNFGRPLGARLSTALEPEEIDMLWRSAQNKAEMPALAIETVDGYVCLRFWENMLECHAPNEIRSTFELALQSKYPNITIEWIDE